MVLYFPVCVSSHSGDLKSHLVLLSKTADSISDGDLVDRRIRSGQNWSLLPTQVTHTHTRARANLRRYPYRAKSTAVISHAILWCEDQFIV